MPSAYFLDTSALITAYLRRAQGHGWVKNLIDPQAGYLVAIAGTTPAEFAASINQLMRGNVFRKNTRDLALKEFWDQIDSGQFLSIAVTSTLVRHAADLSFLYPLRGYDAIQLACAIKFRDRVRQSDAESLAAGDPIFGEPIFLTEDNRLSQAAAAERFSVDSPKSHP